MKRYLFIYNPESKKGNGRSDFDILKNSARRELTDCTFITSSKKGDITGIVEEMAEEFQVIVACGGDGTVNEVASGIVDKENTSLGVVPLGSGNDFATYHGIPPKISEAIHILKQGKIQKLDVGSCNGHYFVNCLGFGFDGRTNRLASQSSLKNGTLRYILAALRANFDRENFSVSIEFSSAHLKRTLMMISFANGSTEGGNFKIAPDASMQDGKLDLIILDPINKYMLPLYLPLFLIGKHRLIKQVNSYQCNQCSIRFDRRVDVHMDGEVIETDSKSFKIMVLSRAITAIVR